jgi:V/A-type H+-transporting ATPase subunit K
MGAFFSDWGGLAIAILGGALAAALCCAGSARGCGITGEAGTGLLSEDPTAFAKVMILQVVPGTRACTALSYWFIVISKLGHCSAVRFRTSALRRDFRFWSQHADGPCRRHFGRRARPCGAGNRQSARQKPNDWFKGVMLCAVVEFYAILGLLASFPDDFQHQPWLRGE